MAISKPSISASLQVQVSPSLVSPIAGGTTIQLPFMIPGCNFLQEYKGIYTPNNDKIDIFNWPDANAKSNAISFILLIVDNPVNLWQFSINPQGNSTDEVAVQISRHYMWTRNIDTGMYLNHLQFDGTTAVQPYYPPMTQGKAINYYCLVANGVVS